MMTTRSIDGLRILIVDDLPATRETVRAMLRELGISNVTEAKSSEQAIEYLRASPKVDLVISDCVMDGISGAALLTILRNRPETETVPFLMMSSQSDETLIDWVKGEEKADFLPKPLHLRQLEEKLSDLLSR
jgi:CheY-like chemotaxis protein